MTRGGVAVTVYLANAFDPPASVRRAFLLLGGCRGGWRPLDDKASLIIFRRYAGQYRISAVADTGNQRRPRQHMLDGRRVHAGINQGGTRPRQKRQNGEHE